MVRLQTGTAMAENDNLQDRERRLTREEELAREREKLRTGAWMNLAVAMVTVGIFTPGVTLVMHDDRDHAGLGHRRCHGRVCNF